MHVNLLKIKRRRRDLNPRAALTTCTLSRGVPSASWVLLQKKFFKLKTGRIHAPIFSGEDGIRTHAPVKTNGFQDRRVMTTSLPLHTSPRRSASFSADRIISLIFASVKQFFQFFSPFSFFSFFMYFMFFRNI